MYARLLATFCLVAVLRLNAASSDVSDTELVVYLRSSPNQPDAPVMQMKREVTALMHTAGYRVEWRLASDGAGDDTAFLAVVALNGTCALPSGKSIAPTASGASLA